LGCAHAQPATRQNPTRTATIATPNPLSTPVLVAFTVASFVLDLFPGRMKYARTVPKGLPFDVPIIRR
jgi:hypothetical protein